MDIQCAWTKDVAIKFTDEKKDSFGYKITKSNIKRLAVSLSSRLFENFHTLDAEEDKDDDKENNIQPDVEMLEVEENERNTENEKSLSERLNDYLAASSKTSAKQTLDKKDITAVIGHEMNIYEQTKKLPNNGFLQVLYDALLTIPPTSVESERAFSVFGYFCNKIRCRLQTATINALIFLRQYYKNMT